MRQVFVGTYRGETGTFPAVLTIHDETMYVEEIPGGKGYFWVVDGEKRIGRFKNRGKAEIELNRLRQVRSYAKGYCFEQRTGKWLTQPYYGRYDTEPEAARAATDKRNYAAEKRKLTKRGAFYPVRVAGVWYGTYGREGEAILIRDLVYRRMGLKPVICTDYEMPLALVTNTSLKRLIEDEEARPMSETEYQEYERRVASLAGPVDEMFIPPQIDVTSMSPEELTAAIAENEAMYKLRNGV